MGRSVAVIGSSGFVGAAVVAALAEREITVRRVPSPRLRTAGRTKDELMCEVAERPELVPLEASLVGVDSVVNAAGNPDASSLDEDGLVGANALLPALIYTAAQATNVRRLVHVSSAVVQNDVRRLDESEDMRPFSSYSLSKVLGEQVLRGGATHPCHVIRYRPPSVHAPGRRVTQKVARIARSRLASVAAPGDQPTPQALLPNVAEAIAFLATCEEEPPAVVIHPWEGVTCAGLMASLADGQDPLRVPVGVAQFVISSAKRLGRRHAPTAANARRLELLWLGQAQAPSWLESTSWKAPCGAEAWSSLVDTGGPS